VLAPSAPATQALNPQGCLFCRRHDGGFISQEHILSEAIGNHEAILPPGVVCDRCNNGPLSLIDQELTDFPPISLMRAERGLPTKAGKATISHWGGTHVVYPERGTLELINPSRKAVRGMREFDPARGKPRKLELTTGWRLTEDRIGRLARAIWKSTLEFVYADHGRDIAFGSLYDEPRQAVLGERCTGWLVVPTESKPQADSCLTYDLPHGRDKPTLPVVVSVFGVVFMTNLLLRDTYPQASLLPFKANVWTFGSELSDLA
jgi:hypothetical protein